MTLNHRELSRQRQKRYYESHKDQISEYHRKRYLRNRDEILRRNRKWQSANRGRVLSTSYKWKTKNKPKVQGWIRRWKQANRDKINTYQRQWYKKNPSNRIHDYNLRKARKKSLPFENCSSKIRLLKKISRFCHWCCCRLSKSNLTIDHVISLNSGGHHINDNLVACCKSCNSSKQDTLVGEWLQNVVSV